MKSSKYNYYYFLLTLFNDILFDPTRVVLNSVPTAPAFAAEAAGDGVGLGR